MQPHPKIVGQHSKCAHFVAMRIPPVACTLCAHDAAVPCTPTVSHPKHVLEACQAHSPLRDTTTRAYLHEKWDKVLEGHPKNALGWLQHD